MPVCPRLARLSAVVLILLIASSPTFAASKHHAPPDPSLPWDTFGFGLNDVRTDSMWLDKVPAAAPTSDDDVPATACAYSRSTKDCLVPLAPISLHPAATVLNYGQSLFEGLKAFRRADGSIALFRPERNARRMMEGANRLLLPPVDEETFVAAADAVVRSNARFVPPTGKGALYLRPLLFGSGEGLGVKPSSESTFCIYCSPVGNYFKGGLRAISLQAVEGYSRAAPGGSGGIKAGGNYAPPFRVQREVRGRGYDEALFLDARHGEAIEEAGASNFFAVFPNNTIVTPPLDTGTILPVVTRASIIELARRECNCQVYERRITIDDLEGACEAFCCGTGASITPVGRVNYLPSKSGSASGRPAKDFVFGDGQNAGAISRKLYKLLLDIQMGNDEALAEKYADWIHVVQP